MRDIYSSDETVESTIRGDHILMSVDLTSMGRVMQQLINMYTDRQTAVIRELSTNAWDSHVEAGINRPIEVDTPTALAPYLHVRDYGVGLSADDIRNIYSKYGASTKRNTDDQVGNLGFGCKSPLTYASQFTLTSNKDGERIIVSVSRGEDNGGSMTIMGPEPTDQPNGVEIVVPARIPNQFREKADKLFQYWPAGSVLVNGQPNKPIQGVTITDDITLVPGGDNVIVMGNVPYPIASEYCLDGLDSFGMVAYVPIGAVQFMGSREILDYTPLTVKTIRDINDKATEGLAAAIIIDIEKAANTREAMRRALAWRLLDKQYWPTKFLYKGKEIPTKIEAGAEGFRISDNRQKLSNRSHHKMIAFGTAVDAVWIHGYTSDGPTPNAKKKMRKWCDEQGITTAHFIMIDKLPSRSIMRWIESKRVVKWDTINAIKLPRSPRNLNGRLRGSFDVYTEKGFVSEVMAKDIDTTAPIYYCTRSMTYKPQRILGLCLDRFNLVIVPDNRQNKFCRDFPDAEYALGIERQFKETLLEWLSVEERRLLAVAKHRSTYSPYRMLKASRVIDPAVKDAVRLLKQPVPRHIKDMLDSLGGFRSEWEDPLDKYPLVTTNTLTYWPDHTYTYMNAAFKQGLIK
jgi:hypothetical protein